MGPLRLVLSGLVLFVLKPYFVGPLPLPETAFPELEAFPPPTLS